MASTAQQIATYACFGLVGLATGLPVGEFAAATTLLIGAKGSVSLKRLHKQVQTELEAFFKDEYGTSGPPAGVENTVLTILQ
ncbi:MAG: hypothetical protein AAFY56_14360, partial [Pseudomonadota bacterium]